MPDLIDFILHISEHLKDFYQNNGLLIYGLIFLVIFCETGLVFAPILPGDSLLLGAGILCHANPELRVEFMIPLLIVAAIAGDFLNYWVGARFGTLIRGRGWVKKKYLDQTHEFFERHGGKAVIYARFAPFLRTFVPFVAGSGAMNFRRFAIFNVIGGMVWVSLFLLAGYFFGGIEFVQKHLHHIILVIVFLSMIPPAIEFWRALRRPDEDQAGTDKKDTAH